MRIRRPLIRAFAIVGILSGLAGVAYFGICGFVYFFTAKPPEIGETFKTEKDTVVLKGSGITDNAFNHYTLVFSEPAADFMQATFSVSSGQLLLNYTDSPDYQGKVELSNTTIGILGPAPGFNLDVLLLAELSERGQSPEVNVTLEKKFAKRTRWWRLKRWVFERYQN